MSHWISPLLLLWGKNGFSRSNREDSLLVITRLRKGNESFLTHSLFRRCEPQAKQSSEDDC